jgi:hypothetical protein
MTKKNALLVYPAFATSFWSFNGLPIAFPKKWPYDLPMNRVWSGRRGFEADLNRFALIPPVHRTQPCDDLYQQAVIRPR